jgi:hypothetical protein
MEYNRTFAHKTHGHIGAVVFETPKGEYKINGMKLPDSSVSHLMVFALQTLQDAYAGSNSTDEALGAFNGKLDKLLNGTIGTRGSGDGVDERTRVARSVVHLAAKVKFGAKSADWAMFTALADDERNAKLDAWYAANAAAFDPSVDEEMAARAAKRARNAKMAATVEITM